MTTNRTVIPPIHTDTQFHLSPIRKLSLYENIPLYHFPATSKITKILLTFHAGIIHQQCPLQAHYTGKMLLSGTTKIKEEQLLEYIETLGASVNTITTPYFTHLTALCIEDKVEKVTDILYHMLSESVFPEKKLKQLTSIDKQEHLIKRQNVAYVARSQFMNALFSDSHPLGIIVQPEHFDTLQQENIIHFFRHQLTRNSSFISVTGTINEHIIEKFSELFKMNIIEVGKSNVEETVPVQHLKNKVLFTELPGAAQSAIIAGCLLPGLSNPDFPALQFVVRLLGGYFGSRLMTRLRQEKGYTYGAHASLTPEKDFSILTISTEVRASTTDESVDIIKHEIERLQSEYISDEELQTVKMNEMSAIMEQLDGMLAQSKFQTNLLVRNINPDMFLENYLSMIKQMNAETVKYIATNYLNINNFVISICGQK